MNPYSFLQFKTVLKQYRESHKLTMVDLSNLSNVSQSYISQLEKGKVPTDDMIDSLAKGFATNNPERSLDVDYYNSTKALMMRAKEYDELITLREKYNNALKKLNETIIDFPDDLELDNQKMRTSLFQDLNEFLSSSKSNEKLVPLKNDTETLELNNLFNKLDDNSKKEVLDFIKFKLR